MVSKILLVDVDGKEGNLALAKLSAYYKSKGDNVTYLRLNLKGYPHKKHKTVDASEYDMVFASNLFEINQDKFEILNCDNIQIGGMGSKYPDKVLPSDIDKQIPDQEVFTDGYSRGYLTRGCIRQCYFCKVWKYEGMIRKENTIKEIMQTNKVKFMDNNILAYKYHYDILQQIIDENIKCTFNQGLDIRLLNNKNAELLSKINYIGEYIFAFDNIEDEQLIDKKLSIFKRYISSDWKAKFYIYHNEEFGNIKDLIYRVEWCRKNKVLPYVMRDKNCWDSKNKNFLIDYAAYANQPAFFKKMSYEEFLNKRHSKQERIDESTIVYNNNK